MVLYLEMVSQIFRDISRVIVGRAIGSEVQFLDGLFVYASVPWNAWRNLTFFSIATLGCCVVSSNFSLRDLSTKGKYLVMLGKDSWLRQTRHQDRYKINTSIALSSDVSVSYFTLHFKQWDVFMFTCKDLSYFEVCCSVCVNIGPILNYKFSSSPSASK